MSPPVSRASPVEHKLSSIEHHGISMLVHEPSGVRFSLGNHLFRAGPTHRYDKRGHDVSMRYSTGLSAIISFYVHPFPLPRSVALFDEFFSAAVTDMLGAMSSTTNVEERRTAFAHASSATVLGRRCEARGVFSAESTAKIFDRASVELFVHQSWILKVRTTCCATTSSIAEQFIATWLVSSGVGGE
jgi:hypothetical protein